MPGRWESTILLRVTDVAYVRSRPHADGREIQELVECPQCRRDTDWLIAAAAGHVEFACRCGHDWEVSTDLAEVVAMAQEQPRTPGSRSFDDVRRDLGFRTDDEEPRRSRSRGRPRDTGPDNVIPLRRNDPRRPPLHRI